MTAVENGQSTRVVIGDDVDLCDGGRTTWKGRHLAHAKQWGDVIRDVYGHPTFSLSALAGEQCVGVLPATIIRRPLFGTVIASMPFLDGGGPWAASAEAAQLLASQLIRIGQDMGARLVDIRCAEPLPGGWTPRAHKANLTLALSGDGDHMWKSLDGAVRNQVRKAERAGLWIDEGAEHLHAFYDIYLARMRDLGSPAHARTFFEAVVRAFGPRARIVVVRRGSDVIGGLVALTVDDTVTVPWAACLREHFALCPNMLLYWHTIRAASVRGLRVFDFGRSTVGSGTDRFKRQWGAVPQPLFWYAIPHHEYAQRPHVPGLDALTPVVAAGWRALPCAVTSRVGPLLRRYLVQ